jgi:hypothetical protein
MRYEDRDLLGVYMSLQRIEQAIERLEAAAQQPTPELAKVQASNLRLREAVVMSMIKIDALLASQGAEPQA